MLNRGVNCLGVLSTLIALSTSGPVLAQDVAGETGEDEASYTAPRTSYGQPDLQGFWNHQTYTPLERPDGVTGEFYSLDEVMALEESRARGEAQQTVPGTCI